MRDYYTYKPTEEVMKKYKIERPVNSTDYALQIRSYLLKPHEDTAEVIKDLRFKLQMWLYTLRTLCNKAVYDQYAEDNEVEFVVSGGYINDWLDENELLETMLKKLVLLADVVRTPDYFEEGEQFYEKLNEVDGELDYIKDEAVAFYDAQIRDELKEFIVTETVNDNDSSI